jgi:hypothetical protein
VCGIPGTDEQLPKQPRNGGRVQELGRSQMANEPNLSKNNPGTGVGSKEFRTWGYTYSAIARYRKFTVPRNRRGF